MGNKILHNPAIEGWQRKIDYQRALKVCRLCSCSLGRMRVSPAPVRTHLELAHRTRDLAQTVETVEPQLRENVTSSPPRLSAMNLCLYWATSRVSHNAGNGVWTNAINTPSLRGDLAPHPW